MDLGKLKEVEVREAWDHEASDFTNWLAKDENLEFLSEELNISNIKVLKTEADAGDFKIDILAEEEQTGNKIIIENQLEKTDHKHLGQIITYASSQDAKYVIWIAKKIRDEHKQAVDWLNKHTDDELNFFAVQIELWKIGDSLPAPKFSVISKPNDWTKAVKSSFKGNQLRDMELLQLDFWKEFKEYAEEKNSLLRFRSPRPQHWYNFAIGSSEAHMALTLNSKETTITCDIYIPRNNRLFKKLEEYKEDIEKLLGVQVEWMELPDKIASRIRLSHTHDFTVKKDWNEGFSWFKEWGETFQRVFGDYIRKASAENRMEDSFHS